MSREGRGDGGCHGTYPGGRAPHGHASLSAGVSGAAALLLAAVLEAALPALPVDIAAAGPDRYSLRESADGRSLVLNWNGTDTVIGSCGERLLQWVDLHRGGLSASVVERNCGATVDYATQVVVDGPEGRSTVAVFQGRSRVALAWDGRRLQVRRPWLPPEKVFLEQRGMAGFGIDYATLGLAALPTAQRTLDESNRGWGAHGRSVGLPEEVLLRWAGWAQQASGLYRADWGRWDGPAPYGDDRQGRERIREGMQDYASNGDSPG